MKEMERLTHTHTHTETGLSSKINKISRMFQKMIHTSDHSGKKKKTDTYISYSDGFFFTSSLLF